MRHPGWRLQLHFRGAVNATDHPRNVACYEVEQVKVIAKDVDNDRGRVARQDLFDALRKERFEDKVYPWKWDQSPAQFGLRMFRLIPRQTCFEGDFELAVVRAPGILRLFRPSDTLCDRAHHRQLGQRSGHEPSESL